MQDAVTNFLKQYAQDLVDFKKAFEVLKSTDGVADVADLTDLDNDTNFKGVWGNISTYTASVPNPYTNTIKVAVPANGPIPAHDAPDYGKIQLVLQKLHAAILNASENVLKSMEEFLLFLPQTSNAQAMQVAERLLAAVNAIQLAVLEQSSKK